MMVATLFLRGFLYGLVVKNVESAKDFILGM